MGKRTVELNFFTTVHTYGFDLMKIAWRGRRWFGVGGCGGWGGVVVVGGGCGGWGGVVVVGGGCGGRGGVVVVGGGCGGWGGVVVVGGGCGGWGDVVVVGGECGGWGDVVVVGGCGGRAGVGELELASQGIIGPATPLLQ